MGILGVGQSWGYMVPNRDVVAKLIDPTTIGRCSGTSVDLEWVILSRRIDWEVGITFAVAVHHTIQITRSVVLLVERRKPTTVVTVTVYARSRRR